MGTVDAVAVMIAVVVAAVATSGTEESRVGLTLETEGDVAAGLTVLSRPLHAEPLTAGKQTIISRQMSLFNKIFDMAPPDTRTRVRINYQTITVDYYFNKE
ncbi:hypothetical protein WDW86_06505 [Bdellovibrionota bacterium FG-2]